MKGTKEIKISKNKDKFIEDVIQNFKETNNSARLLTSNAAYPVYVTEIGIIISFGILASLIFLPSKQCIKLFGFLSCRYSSNSIKARADFKQGSVFDVWHKPIKEPHNMVYGNG